MTTYLQDLTVRLASGLGRLDEAQRTRHIEYLLAAQRGDGGFGGRQGDSDLYYTSFALRGLSILGELYGPVAEKAGRFLQQQIASKQTIVDFFSLFYAGQLLRASSGLDIFSGFEKGWQDNIAQFLETLRREDGGFAKAPEGHAGSTYNSFLVILVYELIEKAIPNPEQVLGFLKSRMAEDGGWHEIRASKRAGTNPSAAAAATIRILGEMESETKELTLDFLCEMQTDEGGLRANTRIPIADLLSSFTGGLTLDDLGGFDEIDVEAFRKFVSFMERSEGGFQAAAWDEAHDVEYTFYGLGCLALLANFDVR
jgi:geranylgeranyl transferase type-2 subunit beta